MAKKIDELERPKIPGYIDMSKVNSASAGVAAARDAVNNLNYDTFKQGTAYNNLKKSYEQQGQTAMKDTLGQVASRTGGMASSYATSAASQSYNNYMQTMEDAARSMFNDEYSKKMDAYNMAQQEYGNAYGEYRDKVGDSWNRYNAENSAYVSDRDHNYQVGRDEKADSDAAKQDEIDMISSDAYYGRSVSWEQYLAAHPNTQLTQEQYESIVAAGEGSRTDENRTNVDNEIMSILSDEDFNWDTDYESIAGLIANSSYGEDYWRQYAADKQQGYADQDTKDTQTANTNRIDAMLKNGASIEDIEKEFGIGPDGETWESVTGMSKDEWQAKQTGYKQGSYKFQDTVAGRSEIVNKFAESGNLSAADQDNFDYLYGDGAYETLTNSVNKFGNDLGYTLMQWKDGGYDPDFLDNYIDDWERRMMSDIPGISQTQLDDIIESQFPDLANWLLNPEDAKQYVGKYYLDGRWITPAG